MLSLSLPLHDPTDASPHLPNCLEPHEPSVVTPFLSRQGRAIVDGICDLASFGSVLGVARVRVEVELVVRRGRHERRVLKHCVDPALVTLVLWLCKAAVVRQDESGAVQPCELRAPLFVSSCVRGACVGGASQWHAYMEQRCIQPSQSRLL